jgi:RNA polymerase sigma-70 factor, ECF subfamily
VTVHADPTSDHRTRFEADAIPYMRQMFPAALRLTQEKCDAEDLIQETFARAYQKFDQFTPGTNLRGWLYCIMVRTFYGMCRSRSRRPAEVLAAELYESVDGHDALVVPSRSAEAEALSGISDSAIMAALSELPSGFKTVIYLADIEGYQYSDIAQIMGTPLGTVMSRIHRGRQMLRARLLQVAPATATVPAQPARRASNSAPRCGAAENAAAEEGAPQDGARRDGVARPRAAGNGANGAAGSGAAGSGTGRNGAGRNGAARNGPPKPAAVSPRIAPLEPDAARLAA